MTAQELTEYPQKTVWLILIVGVLVSFIVHLWARGELKWMAMDIRNLWRKILRTLRK